jgi:hypothetical protein
MATNTTRGTAQAEPREAVATAFPSPHMPPVTYREQSKVIWVLLAALAGLLGFLD